MRELKGLVTPPSPVAVVLVVGAVHLDVDGAEGCLVTV